MHKFYQFIKICMSITIFILYFRLSLDIGNEWNNTTNYYFNFHWEKLSLTVLSTIVSYLIFTIMKATSMPKELWYLYIVSGLGSSLILIIDILFQLGYKKYALNFVLLGVSSAIGYCIHTVQQKENK